jgi:hypothetical protein
LPVSWILATTNPFASLVYVIFSTTPLMTAIPASLSPASLMDYTFHSRFLKVAEDLQVREWQFEENPLRIWPVPCAYSLGKTLGGASFKSGRTRFHNYSTSICGLLNHNLFVSNDNPLK